MKRSILLAAALAVVAASCSRSPAPPVRPPSRPADDQALRAAALREPQEVPLPQVQGADRPLDVARKLAAYMEARWPRMHVRPDADALGHTAAFGVSIDYDRYAGDDAAWAEGVRAVTGDLREASVELLKLAVRYFPALRWASVWEDRILIFFWSTDQIVQMGDPASYRDFEAFRQLRREAAIQPPLLEQARREAGEGG